MKEDYISLSFETIEKFIVGSSPRCDVVSSILDTVMNMVSQGVKFSFVNFIFFLL
jgi:hypothetical protein